MKTRDRNNLKPDRVLVLDTMSKPVEFSNNSLGNKNSAVNNCYVCVDTDMLFLLRIFKPSFFLF